MSNLIINPWLIYTVNLIYNISEMLFVATVIIGFGFLLGILLYIFWRCDGYNSKYKEDIIIDKKSKLYLKRTGTVLAILMLLNLVIPSKEIMYAMVAIKYITVENINGGTETVKSAVDYVFEKIDGLSD